MPTTPNDTITFPEMAATVQACNAQLGLVLGEWPFDEDEGFPLFEEVLVKDPNLERVRALVRRQLLNVRAGVDLLLNDAGDVAVVNGDFLTGRVYPIVSAEVTASFDSQTRTLYVSWEAFTESGQALRGNLVRAGG